MAKTPNLPILSAALESIIEQSESKDISLSIKGDTAVMVVKDLHSGAVITQTLHKQGLQQWSSFNPTQVSVEERKSLVKKLINDDNMTQSEVSQYLGISQSQVSKDYRN